MGCGASAESNVDRNKYTRDASIISHGAISAVKPASDSDEHRSTNFSINLSLRPRTTEMDKTQASQTANATSPSGEMDTSDISQVEDPLAAELAAVDIQEVYRNLKKEALQTVQDQGVEGLMINGTSIMSIGQYLELSRADLARIRNWTDFKPPHQPVPVLDNSDAGAGGKCPRDYNLQQNQELLDAHYMHAGETS
eukprot:TRINITY_DN72857_c0_g1_i1.p2 TRINITY_DN72857_c0_g1~~TRINITY_DN72857_c0_g1_i1.p2  ORF type:complete len:196 (+),score=39.94 TRINITY_DN72857_c0_g1_i1:410-997(+)